MAKKPKFTLAYMSLLFLEVKEGIGKTHLNYKIILSNDILPGHSLQCNTKELMQTDYPCKEN